MCQQSKATKFPTYLNVSCELTFLTTPVRITGLSKHDIKLPMQHSHAQRKHPVINVILKIEFPFVFKF